MENSKGYEVIKARKTIDVTIDIITCDICNKIHLTKDKAIDCCSDKKLYSCCKCKKDSLNKKDFYNLSYYDLNNNTCKDCYYKERHDKFQKYLDDATEIKESDYKYDVVWDYNFNFKIINNLKDDEDYESQWFLASEPNMSIIQATNDLIDYALHQLYEDDLCSDIDQESWLEKSGQEKIRVGIKALMESLTDDDIAQTYSCDYKHKVFIERND